MAAGAALGGNDLNMSLANQRFEQRARRILIQVKMVTDIVQGYFVMLFDVTFNIQQNHSVACSGVKAGADPVGFAGSAQCQRDADKAKCNRA
jgi:hypothetical protein